MHTAGSSCLGWKDNFYLAIVNLAIFALAIFKLSSFLFFWQYQFGHFLSGNFWLGHFSFFDLAIILLFGESVLDPQNFCSRHDQLELEMQSRCWKLSWGPQVYHGPIRGARSWFLLMIKYNYGGTVAELSKSLKDRKLAPWTKVDSLSRAHVCTHTHTSYFAPRLMPLINKAPHDGP